MDTNKELKVTPDEIDIFDFLEGNSYPAKTITLYTDQASAKKLRTLMDAKNEGDVEDMGKLRQAIADTSLTFELRGIEPGKVSDLYDAEGDDAAHLNQLILESIVSVKTGKGQVVKLTTIDAIDALRRKLNMGEAAKLIEAVQEVNFDSALFDVTADAGFPGGRTEPTA